jgi:hypothetical protein
LVSDRPYLENGSDEERYVEGMVVINNGTRICGINDTPKGMGLVGYLYTKLPKKKIKERMDHFKEQAQQLMEIRKSGHRSGKKIRGAKKGKKTKRL